MDGEVVLRAFELALRDLVALLPKAALSIVVASLFFAAGLLLTRFAAWLMAVARLDSYLEPYVRSIGVRPSTLVVAALDIGVALAAVYAITAVVAPEYLGAVSTGVQFVARLVSIVFMVVFVLVIVNAITEHMRIVAKVRGFMALLSALITMVLILDITALSPEVKHALAWGISLGLGISIGVFTAWYFFREVLERRGLSNPSQRITSVAIGFNRCSYCIGLATGSSPHYW